MTGALEDMDKVAPREVLENSRKRRYLHKENVSLDKSLIDFYKE